MKLKENLKISEELKETELCKSKWKCSPKKIPMKSSQYLYKSIKPWILYFYISMDLDELSEHKMLSKIEMPAILDIKSIKYQSWMKPLILKAQTEKCLEKLEAMMAFLKLGVALTCWVSRWLLNLSSSSSEDCLTTAGSGFHSVEKTSEMDHFAQDVPDLSDDLSDVPDL